MPPTRGLLAGTVTALAVGVLFGYTSVGFVPANPTGYALEIVAAALLAVGATQIADRDLP